MPERLKRKTWRGYAGCVIRGSVPVEPVTWEESSHLQRASWLTAMVESGGVYGTVQNFDGTGMTAGIHQAIAVYPKERVLNDDMVENDQGPLWELLRRIHDVAEHSRNNSFLLEYLDFYQALLDAGWYISPAGVLVHNEAAATLVDGYEIREEFTGSRNGVMPTKGEARECAEEWVKRFHRLFSHEETHKIQQRLGMEHICRNAKRWKMGDFYGDSDISGVELPMRSSALDLALCMFWNYSVNAPSIARKCVQETLEEWKETRFFAVHEMAKYLINKLGNNKYGRWDDDLKNGRYQRTRKAAMQVWPKELFTGKWAVMPKDLEG